jgi:hypothetical protein
MKIADGLIIFDYGRTSLHLLRAVHGTGRATSGRGARPPPERLTEAHSILTATPLLTRLHRTRSTQPKNVRIDHG